MHVFITGTDTAVGKTLTCSWLCLHTGYDYFKPIQTGAAEGCDSDTVRTLSGKTVIHKETFLYQAPLSPHISARLEGEEIDLGAIELPSTRNVIIEGAGGVLVPLNKNALMIDLIKQLAIPVIVVARASLGTINHSLLTVSALRARNIDVLGVIMNGINPDNAQSISAYGAIPILATLPLFTDVTPKALHNFLLPPQLQQLYKDN